MTPLTPLLLVYAVPVDPPAPPVPGLLGVPVSIETVGSMMTMVPGQTDRSL